jgi:hypothetical protein
MGGQEHPEAGMVEIEQEHPETGMAESDQELSSN